MNEQTPEFVVVNHNGNGYAVVLASRDRDTIKEASTARRSTALSIASRWAKKHAARVEDNTLPADCY